MKDFIMKAEARRTPKIKSKKEIVRVRGERGLEARSCSDRTHTTQRRSSVCVCASVCVSVCASVCATVCASATVSAQRLSLFFLHSTCFAELS